MQGITHAPAPGGAAALAGVPGRQQGKTFSALLEALRGPLQSAALGARVALICRNWREMRLVLDAADALLSASSLDPSWTIGRHTHRVEIGFGYLQLLDATLAHSRGLEWPGPVHVTAEAFADLHESRAETWRIMAQKANAKHARVPWPPVPASRG